MSLTPLTIFDSAAYFQELLRLVADTKKGNRVALTTMSFDPSEPHISKLMHELTAAAARGVVVHLLVDALTFSLDHRRFPSGPTMLKREISKAKQPYFRNKYIVLEKLKASGGQYRIINFPNRRFSNPYAGRSHIKAAVINDIVFTGGCNLSGSWQSDFMVQSKDKTTAAWLYELILDTDKSGSVRQTLQDTDRELTIDPVTTLFVDAGKPKQSIIYEEALKLIDAAQEWLVMTCQFFPNTITAKHLAAAHQRGVKIKLYYNHPRHQAIHERWVHHAVILGEKTRHPKVLFDYQLPKAHKRIHAKLIATEQGAMIGSHNYVTHGVNFGTAEIAMLRHDPAFARKAVAILASQVHSGTL